METTPHNGHVAFRAINMKYVSPYGALIVGTAETILATATISEIDPESGVPSYAGGTEVHWDTQVTRDRDGKILFVCESGHEWTFDELKPLDFDNEPPCVPAI